MAVPSDLSFESVRIFMLERGGKVTNHELVKFFKPALTRDDTKVEARNQFKEFVNVLANIKNEDGEKYLILKQRFCNSEPVGNASHYGTSSPSPSLSSPCPSVNGSMLSISQESLLESPSRAPPPYRPPPPPTSSPRYNSPQQGPPPSYVSPPPPSMLRHVEGQETEQPPPPVPPRRRSSDKGKENMLDPNKRPKTEGEEATIVKKDVHADSSEPKISVKERTQKFNRLASESDLKPLPQLPSSGKKKVDKGADEEFAEPLDAKSREWLVRSSQSDYHVMTKMVAEKPKLARLRDPYVGYTALHWAAKNGNKDIVKMLAGNYQVDVNARTRGGMTPLHIAMQFGHEEVYQLLVQVYKGDPNIRDYSGKKPRQYLVSKDTSVSADTYHKIKSRKKNSDKDLGFLRIGSLNVRVKKTTEAFSNFLMGSSSTERLHKTWGSADNIQEMDRQNMPPPKVSGSRRRRGARRSPSSIQLKSTGSVPLISVPMSALTASEEQSQSTPSTPHQPRALSSTHGPDSDSDTACGFGDNWKNTV